MRSVYVVPALVLFAALPIAIARIVFLAPRPELSYEGVTFRPDDLHAGVLQAFDSKTGQLLWEKRLYDHFMVPLLEADVQWHYIDGIFLDKEKNRLFVRNDADTLIALDLASRDTTVFELGNRVTAKVVDRKESGQDYDELLIMHGEEVLQRFPSVGSAK
ncbi:MAG: hypothetical protein IT365_05875 [Candidatus Hydrogenedentes bacterium]|nr:hypothetical protein [Candidatus Hydrogenedentota bacterium]